MLIERDILIKQKPRGALSGFHLRAEMRKEVRLQEQEMGIFFSEL